MRHKGILIAGAMALTLAAGSTKAATIVGLFNTGTDATGAALVGASGTVDPHYQIVASTAGGFVGQQARTFFNVNYIANDADSRWVSLSGAGTPGNTTSTYRLTFDLTGLDPLTASVSGSWAVDNQGSIRLNGAVTGYQLTGVTVLNFNRLYNFTLNSGFVTGLNTLDFEVIDNGQPTALRVDNLTGTANPLRGGVPEPSTWALMISGFGMVGAFVRRRRAVPA